MKLQCSYFVVYLSMCTFVQRSAQSELWPFCCIFVLYRGQPSQRWGPFAVCLFCSEFSSARVVALCFIFNFYRVQPSKGYSLVYVFWATQAILQLSGGSHHCQWQGCKFRPTVCLALTAFSSEGSFMCHGISVFKVISERPMILTSEYRALGEGAITTYFKRLRFDAAGPSGARPHDHPDAKWEHYHKATPTGRSYSPCCVFIFLQSSTHPELWPFVGYLFFTEFSPARVVALCCIYIYILQSSAQPELWPFVVYTYIFYRVQPSQSCSPLLYILIYFTEFSPARVVALTVCTVTISTGCTTVLWTLCTLGTAYPRMCSSSSVLAFLWCHSLFCWCKYQIIHV
jgi:hypothetical protein